MYAGMRKDAKTVFSSLMVSDPAVFDAIQCEIRRQSSEICLISSENTVSLPVLEAQGSALTNKYAEGYPGARYYGGCEFIDIVENLAIDRAKQLFRARHANVQPHSGSQANQAVFMALLEANDLFMGLSLASGGHLTHGSTVNLSGKMFRAVPYEVRTDNHMLDMDEVRSIAISNKPKIIIAGYSGYSRLIDFKAFREIADEVGAIFLVDMAHFAGLVAGGVYPNPLEYAHVVTSTTHKTLRGPRGGVIFTDDDNLSKKINSAVFPGLQGGPLMHVIAAKAVAFGEALKPEFKTYANNVVINAKQLAKALIEDGLSLVSGGTDTHHMIVDLRGQGMTGDTAEKVLKGCGFVCNKNVIPFDPQKPAVTSGLRIGTPSGTTRGFGSKEFTQIGHMLAEAIHEYARNSETTKQAQIRKEVALLCARFPTYVPSQLQ